MSIKKYLCVTLSAAIILSTFPASIGAKSFTDVNDQYWANNDISSMSDTGVLDGYDDGTFRPNEKVTREEFAKIMVTSFGLDPIQGDSSFSDVATAKWSKPYIEAAKEYMTHYTGPTGKVMFKPSEAALREDVAVALVKALDLEPIPENKNTINRFRDKNNISLQLRNYIAVAVEKGLINGFEDNTFRGQEPVTRAQAATILNRIVKNAGQQEKINLNVYKFEPSVEDPNIIEFEGKTNPGTKIKLNEYELEVQDDGTFTGTYRFRTNGIKNVVFTATDQLGKKLSITKTININIDPPNLIIDDIPLIVNDVNFNLSGLVEHISKIKINDSEVNITSNNRFSYQINLSKGLNVIKIEYRDVAEMAYFKYVQVTYTPTTVTSVTYN